MLTVQKFKYLKVTIKVVKKEFKCGELEKRYLIWNSWKMCKEIAKNFIFAMKNEC